MLNHRFNNHRRFSRGVPPVSSRITSDGGNNSGIALIVGGRIWITGNNYFGQYGRNWTGSNVYVVKPIQLSPNNLKLCNASKQKDAPAGAIIQTLGISATDGLLWGWGLNTSGELGDNSVVTKNSPVTVAGGGSWISAIASCQCSYGLKSGGTAWAWGTGIGGGLGNNSTTSRLSPVSVVGQIVFSKLAACNYRSGAGIRSIDGTAWTWGTNTYGELGDNTTAGKSSPISVVGDHIFSDIVGGYLAFFALKSSDGSIWAWGYNTYGELGDSTQTSKSSPVSVVGNHSFIQVNPGALATYALKADGSVWSWGANTYGELGDNTSINRSSPVSVVGEHSFISVVGSYYQAFAIKSDGTVWVWGRNQYYELGPTKGSWSSPVLVSALSGRNISIKQILPGRYDTHFIDINNVVWGMGTIQTGMFQICCRSKPIVTWKNPQRVLSNQEFIDGNVIEGMQGDDYFGGQGLSNDGSVWMWGGLNTYGELGDNTIVAKYTPVSVVGNRSYKSIGFRHQSGAALDEATFSVYSWGSNNNGQLGDNTGSNRSSPVSVVGGHSFSKLFVGRQNLYFIRTDGTGWACGGAYPGKLGNNTTTGDKSSPVSIVGNHLFTEIYATDYTVVGIDTNNYGWAWGDNGDRLIGVGDGTDRSSPTSISGNHLWSKIQLGANHAIGLRTDGTCWGWGRNDGGQIGDGTATTRSVPTSVYGNHSFIDIVAGRSCSIAIKANGEIWGWGGNVGNQLLGLPGGSATVVTPVKLQFNSCAVLRYNGFIDDNNLFWDETN